jgi:hypothetical protein
VSGIALRFIDGLHAHAARADQCERAGTRDADAEDRHRVHATNGLEAGSVVAAHQHLAALADHRDAAFAEQRGAADAGQQPGVDRLPGLARIARTPRVAAQAVGEQEVSCREQAEERAAVRRRQRAETLGAVVEAQHQAELADDVHVVAGRANAVEVVALRVVGKCDAGRQCSPPSLVAKIRLNAPTA